MSVARDAGKRRRHRRDVSERSSTARYAMIRFVVAPDGMAVPDLAERLPGRGIWLMATRSAITGSLNGRGFARAARRAVRVSPALAEEIEALLRRRCIDGLGLARRAGSLVFGHEKVAEWLRQGRVGLLVTAVDASEGQRRRLLGAAGDAALVPCLSREEIGQAVGRDEAAYAAVAVGALAERLARDLRRLAGVLGLTPASGSVQPIPDDGLIAEAGDESDTLTADEAVEAVDSTVLAVVERRPARPVLMTRRPAEPASTMNGQDRPVCDNEDDDAA